MLVTLGCISLEIKVTYLMVIVTWPYWTSCRLDILTWPKATRLPTYSTCLSSRLSYIKTWPDTRLVPRSSSLDIAATT